jgi:hypothetical protein
MPMNYPATAPLHWRRLRKSSGSYADTGGYGRYVLKEYGSTRRPMWRLCLDGRTVGVFEHRELALAAAEARRPDMAAER